MSVYWIVAAVSRRREWVHLFEMCLWPTDAVLSGVPGWGAVGSWPRRCVCGGLSELHKCLQRNAVEMRHYDCGRTSDAAVKIKSLHCWSVMGRRIFLEIFASMIIIFVGGIFR